MHPLQKKILDATAGKDWVTIKLREFGRQLSEEHPQMIKYHLYKLEESGYIQIKRNPDLSFDIKNLNRPGEITSAGGGWMTIPVLGAANCGQAATYADHADEGYLRVSDKLVKPKKGLFAIRAIGDSMNRADEQLKMATMSLLTVHIVGRKITTTFCRLLAMWQILKDFILIKRTTKWFSSLSQVRSCLPFISIPNTIRII